MKNFKNVHFLLFLFFMATAVQAQKSPEEKTVTSIPLTAEAVNPLKEGSEIPSITLTTPEGKRFDLNSYVKEQPVVLIFYRGGWCPYCNLHLQELMDADPQLRAMGYEILAVSPDSPEKLAESMEKHEMTYRLLSDSALSAAKDFGIVYQVEESTAKRYKENGIKLVKGSGENQYLLPVPAVFIIDPQGTIRYVYYNPDIKTRIKTEELLHQAKEAQMERKP